MTEMLTSSSKPEARTTTKKIGTTTYTIMSRSNGGKERDIVETIARLIQSNPKKTA